MDLEPHERITLVEYEFEGVEVDTPGLVGLLAWSRTNCSTRVMRVSMNMVGSQRDCLGQGLSRMTTGCDGSPV